MNFAWTTSLKGQLFGSITNIPMGTSMKEMFKKIPVYNPTNGFLVDLCLFVHGIMDEIEKEVFLFKILQTLKLPNHEISEHQKAHLCEFLAKLILIEIKSNES